MHTTLRVLPVSLILPLVAILLSGCTSKGPRQGTGIPVVTVATPVVREVTDYAYFTGRIEAYETIDIRARVGGAIVKVDFLDGAQVSKGDVLFEIDPRPLKAEYDQLQALVLVADANLDLAKAELGFVTRSGSASTVEEKVQKKAAVEVAEANIAKAQADVRRKALDLSFTKVLAPRDGVLGKSEVRAGSLVTGDSSGGTKGDKLATLVSQSPVYVNFDVDEPTHLKVAGLIREGSLRYRFGDTFDDLALAASITGLMAIPGMPGGAFTAVTSMPPGKHFSYYPLRVALGSKDEFLYPGYVDFVNNQLDASTGTLRIRGILKNEQGNFKPGAFVRVKVPIGPKHPAVLIDDKAVANNLDDKFVYVINDKNQAVFRPIKLGGLHGSLREVIGLESTDRVVIVGLQRCRPNGEVEAKNGKMADFPAKEEKDGDTL
jgi:RND family efflux transporter MFP subunit